MNARKYPTTELAPHITRVMVLNEFLALPEAERTTKKYITQNTISKWYLKARSHVSYLARAGVIIPRYIVNTKEGGLIMKLYDANDVEKAIDLHSRRDYEGLYRLWESVCARYIPF